MSLNPSFQASPLWAAPVSSNLQSRGIVDRLYWLSLILSFVFKLRVWCKVICAKVNAPLHYGSLWTWLRTWFGASRPRAEFALFGPDPVQSICELQQVCTLDYSRSGDSGRAIPKRAHRVRHVLVAKIPQGHQFWFQLLQGFQFLDERASWCLLSRKCKLALRSLRASPTSSESEVLFVFRSEETTKCPSKVRPL